MRSVILGALPLAALTAVALFSFGGCTITTSDGTTDGGVDSGVFVDTGTLDDSAVTDTGTPETITGAAVVIRAQDLISSIPDDDIHDFGGGSTFSDIVDGGRIAYGIAKVGTTESNFIGKDTTGAYVDGRITGLTAGASVTITVTGYLRGLNGDDDATPVLRIPWATTTCTAIPSDTVDVIASCTKLSLIADLKGILFTSDVLPASWCATKGAAMSGGKTVFDRLRARSPFDGAATLSRTVDDCLGVIWVPESDLGSIEDGDGHSEWSLSLETNDSATACTLSSPCVIDRTSDIYVVGSACKLDNTTAPRTPACF